jgi:hypothetical protein
MAREAEGEDVAAVRDYYERSAEQEWGRLGRVDDGAVEREMHARALAEFLPPAPARVLDIGGGPGRCRCGSPNAATGSASDFDSGKARAAQTAVGCCTLFVNTTEGT